MACNCQFANAEMHAGELVMDEMVGLHRPDGAWKDLRVIFQLWSTESCYWVLALAAADAFVG